MGGSWGCRYRQSPMEAGFCEPLVSAMARQTATEILWGRQGWHKKVWCSQERKNPAINSLPRTASPRGGGTERRYTGYGRNAVLLGLSSLFGLVKCKSYVLEILGIEDVALTAAGSQDYLIFAQSQEGNKQKQGHPKYCLAPADIIIWQWPPGLSTKCTFGRPSGWAAGVKFEVPGTTSGKNKAAGPQSTILSLFGTLSCKVPHILWQPE